MVGFVIYFVSLDQVADDTDQRVKRMACIIPHGIEKAVEQRRCSFVIQLGFDMRQRRSRLQRLPGGNEPLCANVDLTPFFPFSRFTYCRQRSAAVAPIELAHAVLEPGCQFP
jgi:hypothetical protein